MATKSVTGTVASNLTRFTQFADNFILRNSQNKTYVEAGRHVAMGISNTYYSCEHQVVLEVLREKVDGALQGQLNELESMVEVLEKPDYSMMPAIEERVQQLIKSLQFANWQPQWTGMSSRYAYVIGTHFFVNFLGLFKHASANILKSTLTVAGCTVGRVKNQTKDGLSFELIPGPDFFPESAKYNCHVFKGTLNVAYKGWMGEYWTIYPVWLATHPLFAGAMNLTTINTIKKTISRTIRTGITYTLDPKDSKVGEVVRKQSIFAASGWQITSQPQITSTVPDSIVELSFDDSFEDDSFEMTLTLPKGQETISAEVMFEESKELEEAEIKKTSSCDLLWGKMVEILSSKFELQFQSPDGQTHQLTHQNLKNPYLHFEKTYYGTHKVTALPPTDTK